MNKNRVLKNTDNALKSWVLQFVLKCTVSIKTHVSEYLDITRQIPYTFYNSQAN